MIDTTGKFVLKALAYWLDLFAFVRSSISDWARAGAFSNRANYQSLITQIFFTGITALPIISLLAMIIALGLTSQLFDLSSELGKEIDFTARLSYFVYYELAPLMTALVIVSRSGSAIAVDIGNMKLRGEIDGLTLLGIDVSDYIVAPRILAGIICQIVLSVYFAAIALYVGLIGASLFYSSSYLLLFDDLLESMPVRLFGLFLLKNAFFGAIITSSACYQALQVSKQATTLPQQTQKAIVRALAQIFLLNVLFTGLAT